MWDPGDPTGSNKSCVGLSTRKKAHKGMKKETILLHRTIFKNRVLEAPFEGWRTSKKNGNGEAFAGHNTSCLPGGTKHCLDR